jgi:hypothetical protein
MGACCGAALDVSFDDEVTFGLWVAALRAILPPSALLPPEPLYGEGRPMGVPPPPPRPAQPTAAPTPTAAAHPPPPATTHPPPSDPWAPAAAADCVGSGGACGELFGELTHPPPPAVTLDLTDPWAMSGAGGVLPCAGAPSADPWAGSGAGGVLPCASVPSATTATTSGSGHPPAVSTIDDLFGGTRPAAAAHAAQPFMEVGAPAPPAAAACAFAAALPPSEPPRSVLAPSLPAGGALCGFGADETGPDATVHGCGGALGCGGFGGGGLGIGSLGGAASAPPLSTPLDPWSTSSAPAPPGLDDLLGGMQLGGTGAGAPGSMCAPTCAAQGGNPFA